MKHFTLRTFIVALTASLPMATLAQEKSLNPGINDSFRDPDVDEYVQKFEVESRELFARRKQIVAACHIKPGETVADIGAGTGLFTRLFADAVGKNGRVVAVDIAQKFLDHVIATCRQAGLHNVTAVLATQDSVNLPAGSADLAFICDTYHHFEFPAKTMTSIHQALKSGGRLILIDFRRIPGESSDWVLKHVRAGQEVFEAEIEKAGFEKVSEDPKLLHENYFLIFKKGDRGANGEGSRPAKPPGTSRPIPESAEN